MVAVKKWLIYSMRGHMLATHLFTISNIIFKLLIFFSSIIFTLSQIKYKKRRRRRIVNALLLLVLRDNVVH